MPTRQIPRQRLFWAVLAGLASACGSTDPASNLDHYAAELSDSSAVIQSAVVAHHDELFRQTDLARIADLEREQLVSMTARMGRMQDALDSMTACDHEEQAHQSAQRDAAHSLNAAGTAMRVSMQSGMVEMQRHLVAMAAARDLDGALAEEHQHQGRMNDIIDQLNVEDGNIGDAMGSMRDAGMSMMCPMMSHMHRRH